MYGCRIIGPMAKTPPGYHGLIKFQGAGTSESIQSCALQNVILASRGTCIEASGSDTQVSLMNCLLLAPDHAISLLPGPSVARRPNLQCSFERTTVAAGAAAFRLGDAERNGTIDPVLVQSRAGCFLSPFEGLRGGLLRFEGGALARGLLVYKGTGDGFDSRLAFAALAEGASTPEKREPSSAWVSLWGRVGERDPVAELQAPSIDVERVVSVDHPQFERLALPATRSGAAVGVDFSKLLSRKSKSGR
jgi:hypothetical protein